MTYDQVLSLLGWIALWNLVFLSAIAVLIAPLRDFFAGIHARMFGLEVETIRLEYFRFLAGYKTLVMALFVLPYLAMRFAG